MKWNIITDSSCDMKFDDLKFSDIRLAKVPFVFTIDGKDYVDDENLDVDNMIDVMEAAPEVGRSACPSPITWYEQFEQADYSFAITISSNLSGSHNSAVAAKEMLEEAYPDKKVFILDSLSTGPVLAMYVLKLIELIESGLEYDAVVEQIKDYASKRHTIFALNSFTNLIKNGRMSRLSGFIAGVFGIWGVGVASEVGTIDVKTKTRGIKKIINVFIEEMKEHGFKAGSVIISHCHNFEFATVLKDKIVEIWENAKVQIMPTIGLCSFYAERRGIILGY